MTRRSSRGLAAGFSVVAVAIGVATANGCGGVDCTETETCPGVADAAIDQHVDVTLPPNGDASVLPDALPGDETSVADEAGDLGDAEADAADATIDAVDETTIDDAALDAEAATPGNPADAADAQDDGCVNRGGVENCTNGIDDNCDGLIDCADPKCMAGPGFLGYKCVPQPPTGWIAPVVLYDFTGSAIPAAVPPSCTGNFGVRAFVAHDQPDPPASTCSCTCGGVNGASCTGPTVGFYSNTSCGSELGGSPTPVTGACASVLAQGGVNSVKLGSPGAPSGSPSCTPGVASTIPAFDNTNDWLRTGGGCTTAREEAGVAPVQGGCAAGQVCVENPPSSLGAHTCAAYVGSPQVCGPGGATGYDAGFTYYESATDTRVCSGTACGCGTPSLSCNPSVTIGNSSACNSQPMTLTTTNCQATSNYPSGGTQQVWATGSSTVVIDAGCTPSGTAPLNGGITRTGVVTVCCVQ